MKEEWKPINGYEDYSISNFGSVKSIGKKCGNGYVGVNYRYSTEHILKLGTTIWGYNYAQLWKDGKSKLLNIARCVLEHFGPPKPINTKERIEANHKDGNKKNNKISNLEWTTTHGNHIHAVIFNPLTRGAQRYNAVFTNKDVIKLREMFKTGKYKCFYLAKKYKVSNVVMFNMLTKKTYKYAEEENKNGIS